MSKKAKTQTAAKPRFPISHMKVDELVSAVRKRAESVKGHPSYAQTPEVQQATTAWTASVDQLDDREAKIRGLKVALAALMLDQQGDVAGVARCTTSVLAAVGKAAGGSVEALHQWGFETSVRSPTVPSTDAPEGLKATFSRALVLTLRWKAIREQKGYLLQIGDGTPTGWGPTLTSARSHYMPTGLTPGQHIAVRVAVQRPSGVSAWSDALNVVVR